RTEQDLQPGQAALDAAGPPCTSLESAPPAATSAASRRHRREQARRKSSAGIRISARASVWGSSPDLALAGNLEEQLTPNHAGRGSPRGGVSRGGDPVRLRTRGPHPRARPVRAFARLLEHNARRRSLERDRTPPGRGGLVAIAGKGTPSSADEKEHVVVIHVVGVLAPLCVGARRPLASA